MVNVRGEGDNREANLENGDALVVSSSPEQLGEDPAEEGIDREAVFMGTSLLVGEGVALVDVVVMEVASDSSTCFTGDDSSFLVLTMGGVLCLLVPLNIIVRSGVASVDCASGGWYEYPALRLCSALVVTKSPLTNTRY